MSSADPVNPAHYREHPSGIECIEVTEALDYCTGNAIKYLWRFADTPKGREDLAKAEWYLKRAVKNDAPLFVQGRGYAFIEWVQSALDPTFQDFAIRAILRGRLDVALGMVSNRLTHYRESRG